MNKGVYYKYIELLRVPKRSPPPPSLLTLSLSPPPFHFQLKFLIAHNRPLPIDTLLIQNDIRYNQVPFFLTPLLLLRDRDFMPRQGPTIATHKHHRNPRHNPSQDLAHLPHLPH